MSIASIKGRWTLKYEPRTWQLAAHLSWKSTYRGIVSVVTGGGKTAFGQICIDSFAQEWPDGRVLILVPTASLLDQWCVALQEDFGVAESDIACFSGEERPERPGLINIAVLNTARTLTRDLTAEGNWFLVVDECHRAGSPANALALNGRFVACLGLTATPERQYDDGFVRYISPVLGSILFNYDYVAAHSDGVISQFDLSNIKIPLLRDEQEEYNALTRKVVVAFRRAERQTGSSESLKRLLQRRASLSASAEMRVPVAVKVLEENRGVRSLVFHEMTLAADRLHHVLRERSHSATIYHSKIGVHTRRDNLRMFRRGQYDILICCRALDEGINVPDTRIAVVASSTASIRQRIQRLGRVLRPAPGKSHATVYTLYATKAEERRLREEERRLASIAETHWREVRMP